MASPARTRRRRGRRIPSVAVAIAALGWLAIAVLGAERADAQTSDDIESVEQRQEQDLAERYAPVIMIREQSEPCDTDGEPYRPASVEIVLDNPEVLLRQVGRNDPVMTGAPSATDLFELGEGFYLDFPGLALEPGCIFERDGVRFERGHPPTVYAHVARQVDQPDRLALQYWIFWYYNDWNNKHEGDWEGIQLLFDVGTVEEALQTEPVSVGYAQHEGGERAAWDSGKLERDGLHPIVYSSAGSHASYFGSALYIGRSASEGFGCDNTDGPSLRLDPDVVVLPDDVDDPNDPLAWLAFDGRWGERQSGPFNGPTGPADKDRWTAPIDWHDDLRSGSAVVPAGDSQADGVISAFCGVVEWGSVQLIQLKTSPARTIVTVVIAVIVGTWLVRRTVWDDAGFLPIVRRRRAGQIIRSAAAGYRRRPGALITFGLVYLPTTLLVGAFAAVASSLPVVSTIVGLARDVAQASVAVTLFVGGVASVVSYIAVNAMVAAFGVQQGRDGGRREALDAVRFAWTRRWPLAVGFARATLVVVPLALTIVGIPWAIRQLVRYQFLPQVVVVEGVDGRTALARSSELVRGRWWHTALMVVIFDLMISASGFVIALLLLVGLTSLPFWLYSALVSLVYALIVPLAAIGRTLLYGDAVAEHAEADTDRGEHPGAVDDGATGEVTVGTSDS